MKDYSPHPVELVRAEGVKKSQAVINGMSAASSMLAIAPKPKTWGRGTETKARARSNWQNADAHSLLSFTSGNEEGYRTQIRDRHQIVWHSALK